MLLIVAFTSHHSIIIQGDLQVSKYTLTSIDLLQIQNTFITLLWKYSVCQYEFKEAVLRYFALIKGISDIITTLEEVASMKFINKHLF
jgi:hypothetical protein